MFAKTETNIKITILLTEAPYIFAACIYKSNEILALSKTKLISDEKNRIHVYGRTYHLNQNYWTLYHHESGKKIVNFRYA